MYLSMFPQRGWELLRGIRKFDNFESNSLPMCHKCIKLHLKVSKYLHIISSRISGQGICVKVLCLVLDGFNVLAI